MDNVLRSKHINYKGFFYFFLIEKITLPIFSLWLAFLLSLVYLAAKYGSGEVRPVSIEIYITIAFVGFIALVFLGLITILPAYFRGRFLRKGGYCIITANHIESVCDGRIKIYEYKNRTIKAKKRKDGSTDILIGKSLVDALKHGPILFTLAYFKAWGVLLGFGAPLWRVTNADEVIEYLEANK